MYRQIVYIFCLGKLYNICVGKLYNICVGKLYNMCVGKLYNICVGKLYNICVGKLYNTGIFDQNFLTCKQLGMCLKENYSNLSLGFKIYEECSAV